MLGVFNIDLLKTGQFANDLESTFGLKQAVHTATQIMSTTAMLINHIYIAGLTLLKL